MTRWLNQPRPNAADEPATRAAVSPAPAVGPVPPQPSVGVMQLDTATLEASRETIVQLQLDTSHRIRRLEIDIRGIVSRHAHARANGRSSEKAALIRIFKGLKSRLDAARLFDATLLKKQELIETVVATREYAALRQSLEAGWLAGDKLLELRNMLDVSQAGNQHDLNLTVGLLEDCGRNTEDAVLQLQAEERDIEAELCALSETEYQEQVQALMEPLEDMAQQVEQDLLLADSNAAPVHQASRSAR